MSRTAHPPLKIRILVSENSLSREIFKECFLVFSLKGTKNFPSRHGMAWHLWVYDMPMLVEAGG